MTTERHIQAWDLYTFIRDVHEASVEGYKLSTKSEHFPVQIGNHYFCIMLKEDEGKATEATTNPVEVKPKEEEEEAPRPRRKLRS